MTDELPTVWPAKPHTIAKHEILRRYLNAWFPILSRQSRRARGNSQEILFVDGFAGPGEYKSGKPGSPIIALEAAMGHNVEFPVPVRMLFVEKDSDRCEHLKHVLAKRSQQIADSKNLSRIEPVHGECDTVLGAMLDEAERQGVRFGPALAFLDQFGYAAVSMELIQRLLAFPQCEVFSYLDYKDMNRWITDPSKASGFSRTYGGDEWQQAKTMPERDRRDYLLKAYKKAILDRAHAKYVHDFAMFDRAGRLLYWLVFSTNNLRGLEEMKKAMWKVDSTGSFRFSDKDNCDQMTFLDAYDARWLADELAERLAGQEMTAARIKEYVLSETPCCLFKKALESLETGKKPRLRVVRAPEGRRPGKFPDKNLDHIMIRFDDRGLF